MIYTRYFYAADVARGRRVLEVGCGSGQGFGLMGEQAALVVGGDVDPRLLGTGRQHYGDRFPFVRLVAEALPFRRNSFDVVLAFECSYYFASFPAALDEFSRVLADDGLIVFVNANPERPDFIRSPYCVQYHRADEVASLLRARGFAANVEGAFPLENASTAQRAMVVVRRLLRAAGLVPRTLRARAVLKRLVYGRLRTLPPELPADFEQPAARTAHAAGPMTNYKVYYVTANRQTASASREAPTLRIQGASR